jgi:hypothetical protein
MPACIKSQLARGVGQTVTGILTDSGHRVGQTVTETGG